MTDFLYEVNYARDCLREIFPDTPLQYNDYLSKKYDAEVFLKREDLTPVRSYKIRGAFNFMREILSKDKSETHFVCASAGNHAQGVAYACQYFGVDGTVFMPVTTPQQKIDKTRSFGGSKISVKLTGDYFDQTLNSALKYSRKCNATFLPPFDNLSIIRGQATVMAELIQQMLTLGYPNLILLAVGGGGLSSGMVRYAESFGLTTKFRFVEPAGAASLNAALKSKKRIKLQKINNFIDGAAVGQIGLENFKILKKFSSDSVILSPEDRVCNTMMQLLNLEGLVLEPAGALSIDGLNDLDPEEVKGKRLVCIVSGGNFDFERLPDVKERSLRFSGMKKYLILTMPQRPGALKDFLNLLGPDDDIARFEYLKKSARNFGSVLIGIESKSFSGFEPLFKRIDAAGFTFQDITQNEELKELII